MGHISITGFLKLNEKQDQRFIRNKDVYCIRIYDDEYNPLSHLDPSVCFYYLTHAINSANSQENLRYKREIWKNGNEVVAFAKEGYNVSRGEIQSGWQRRTSWPGFGRHYQVDEDNLRETKYLADRKATWNK